MNSPSHRENVFGDFKDQGICRKTAGEGDDGDCAACWGAVMLAEASYAVDQVSNVYQARLFAVLLAARSLRALSHSPSHGE